MFITKLTNIKKLLLVSIFVALALGYFARINLGTIFIGLYYWDILLAIYLSFSIWLYLRNFKTYKTNLPAFYTLNILFILYAAVVTLSAYRYLNSLSDLIISSLYLLRWSLYVFSGIAIFLDLKSEMIDQRFIKNLIIGEGVLISILGFVQLIFLPDFTALDKSLMWDPHQNRLAGLYFDPNFAGIVLVLILSLLTSNILNLFKYKKAKPSKVLVLNILLFMVIFIAIVLTFSRSAWLAMAVAILVIGIIRFRWIIPIAIIGMFLVYYAIPRVQTRISGVTDPSDSFYYRVISWTETYEVAKKNPIIGYGFNTYRYIRRDLGLIKYDEGLGDRSDSGSDSSLLFIWVTTGVIGLSIFVIANIKLFLQSLRAAKLDNIGLVFTAFQIALLVNSQFINSLFFPALTVNFVIFTAIFLAKGKTIED